MDTETPQQQSLTDADLTDLAVAFVLAMLRSASSEKIDPRDWWERAKSALQTAASAAESWPQMVSRMGAKLQIDELSSQTASSIYSLGRQLQHDFERFRYLAERDALYIVAMARAQRDAEKKGRQV